MSLIKITPIQRNILVNLLGQSSNAVLTFLFVPWYLHYLGTEAYGIVGFYLALQAALAVLDLGFSTAANRELAMLSAQAGVGNDMRTVVRTMQRWYWVMACLVGVALYLLAPMLANHWLRPKDLDPAEITGALQWMALSVALQWPTVFYAGCVGGLQRQTALNLIQFAAALLRFPGIVILFAGWSGTLQVFFVGQGLIAAAQTTASAMLLWRILPAHDIATPAGKIDWHRLRNFAMGVAGISVIGLILTQFDKILLSTYLPLQEFGYYSLASTFVAGLGIVSTPIYAAIFPRFSQMVAAGAREELRDLYHHSAQLLAVLLLPIGVVLIVFPDVALYVWTGNEDIASSTGMILRLLAIGTTIGCLLIVPGALQFAHGWTRLALLVNAGAILLFVPACYLLAQWRGGEGTALALILLNLIYLLVQLPLVHARLLPGDWWRWWRADVLLPLFPIVAINGAAFYLYSPSSRIEGAGFLVVVGLMGLAGSAFAVPVTRGWMSRIRMSATA